MSATKPATVKSKSVRNRQPLAMVGKKAALKSTAKIPSKAPYKPRSSGTVWIDGVKVKILPPVGQGTISAAKIRHAILTVQRAKLKSDTQKPGE